MLRPLAKAASLLAVSAVLFCGACGSSKTRKPTVAVEGKVYWKNDKSPAKGALVIFHPVADATPEKWPEGYPRGTVGSDGSFKLTSYQEDDGAPVGDYAVLLVWPRSAPNEDPEGEAPIGEDRLDGRYNDPNAPMWRKQVKQADNEAKDFVFIIK